jgi:hypothetical protein
MPLLLALLTPADLLPSARPRVRREPLPADRARPTAALPASTLRSGHLAPWARVRSDLRPTSSGEPIFDEQRRVNLGERRSSAAFRENLPKSTALTGSMTISGVGDRAGAWCPSARSLAGRYPSREPRNSGRPGFRGKREKGPAFLSQLKVVDWFRPRNRVTNEHVRERAVCGCCSTFFILRRTGSHPRGRHPTLRARSCRSARSSSPTRPR